MEFDINKALAGHPVRTKNGKEVTSLALYPTAKNYQVAGVVDSSGFLIGSWPYKPLAADIARIGAGHKVVEVTYEA